MGHDFAKKKKAAKKPQKKSLPGWVWLGTGFGGGIFLSFLVYLVVLTPGATFTQQEYTRIETARKPPVQTAEKPSSKPAKPRFDFYTMLPKAEISLPDTTSDPVASREAAAKESYNYTLQAGSFRKMDDADRRRAELSLLGLEPHIKTVRTSSSGTVHRVHVGPFSNRSQLSKARQILISEGIDTLKVKQKAG
jgi:cell division protein FtsN